MLTCQTVNQHDCKTQNSLSISKFHACPVFDVVAWLWRCSWGCQCLPHLHKHPCKGRSYCSCSHSSEVSQIRKSLVCLPGPSLTSPHLRTSARSPAIIWVSICKICPLHSYTSFMYHIFCRFVASTWGRSPTAKNLILIILTHAHLDFSEHESWSFSTSGFQFWAPDCTFSNYSCRRPKSSKTKGFGSGYPESISSHSPMFRQNAACLSLSPVPLGGGRDSELWTSCCICHTQSSWCGWTWHRTVIPTSRCRDSWFLYLVGCELMWV